MSPDWPNSGSSNPYGPLPGQSPLGRPPQQGQPQAGQWNPYGPPPGQQPQAGQWNPYGPPPGQQPQPGYQDPYGQQLYGQPPEPPKKKLRWLKVVVPVAVVLVVALVAVGSFLRSASNAEEGECVHVPEFSSDAEEHPKKVDCDDEEATLRVAVKLEDHAESCPAGHYDELRYEGGPKMCVMLNAYEGECFANVKSRTDGYEKVRCDDPSAEMEVLKVAKDTADPEAACQGTDAIDALVYSAPETVMCVARPNVS